MPDAGSPRLNRPPHSPTRSLAEVMREKWAQEPTQDVISAGSFERVYLDNGKFIYRDGSGRLFDSMLNPIPVNQAAE